MVVDHYSGMKISRPDPRSFLKYDFDFRKNGDIEWRYLNSGDTLSEFNEQAVSTVLNGGEYRIIVAKTGRIIKTNV
jgi:hypothetical protein